MLIALLALQLSGQACPTPALCDLVARAARANRTAGPVRAWSAAVRTDLSVLQVRDRLVEGTVGVEQVASSVRWERDHPFAQHVDGYRSATTRLPGRLDLLVVPTIIPSLAGDRIVTVGRQVGLEPLIATPNDSAVVGAPHPFGPERDAHYRFLGADTTRWTDEAGTEHDVVRLRLVPIETQSPVAVTLEGELWLERTSLRLVRLRGRIVAPRPPPAGLLAKLLNTPYPIFIDVSQVLVDGAWVPGRQRFEWVAAAATDAEPSGGLRVVSAFSAHRIEPLEPEVPDTALARFAGATISIAPSDSIRRFRDWRHPLGDRDTTYALQDFDDIRLGPPGAPRGRWLAFAPRQTTEIVRYNRVEGVYLGGAFTLRPPRAVPGTEMHAVAGYGFLDRQVRGDLSADLRLGDFTLGAFGGRYLDHANEFYNPFQTTAFAAVLSRDNWDYVDRRAAGLRGAWRPRWTNGSGVMLDAAWVRDDSVSQNMSTTPYVGFLRNVRGIVEGEYLRARLQVDLRPGVAAVFVRNGLGIRLQLEAGEGDDISYQRAVARAVAQHHVRGLTFNAQWHAGWVTGSAIPPQQLLEFGGAVALPGFEYKEFAGNVAALARLRTALSLPFLQRPIPFTSIAIPPPLPTVALGIQGGWADVTSSAARRALAGLGSAFDTDIGGPAIDPGTGLPLPASVPTNGIRGSVDLRLSLFNDALGVGIAQPLESGRTPAIFVVWGQGF